MAAMIKTIRRNAKTYSMKIAGANSFDNDGFASEAVTVPSNIEAVIQPMDSKELRNMPQGQNTLQWIVIWSEVLLPEEAEVAYGGSPFTIQKTQFWDDGGFYIAKAARLED